MQREPQKVAGQGCAQDAARRCMPACLALIAFILAPLLRAQDAACEQAGCPGFDLAAGYTADFRRNTRGGLARGNAASGLLEAGAAWRLALHPDARLTTSVSLIHVGGDGISGERVGDLQGLNNIEADHGWYLYDLWTELAFGAGQATSLRAGLLDLNAEFDSSDTNGFFTSPPFGIGTDLAQTGENGPAIFPVTGLGLRLGGQLGEQWQWRMAAFEGSPGRTDRHRFATIDFDQGEGALLIGEVGFSAARLHQLALGTWSYTARFERIDAASTGHTARNHGNRGAYFLIDAPLGALGGARVDGVLRAGVADARFNAIGSYVGAAMVASNLLPGRPGDGLGIAVAHARTGRQFRQQLQFDAGRPARSETALELTWRAPLASWLAIVPSLQWIDSPGADRERRDAFVVGMRFEMAIERSWTMLARTPPARGAIVASLSSQ
jgi:porin